MSAGTASSTCKDYMQRLHVEIWLSEEKVPKGRQKQMKTRQNKKGNKNMAYHQLNTKNLVMLQDILRHKCNRVQMMYFTLILVFWDKIETFFSVSVTFRIQVGKSCAVRKRKIVMSVFAKFQLTDISSLKIGIFWRSNKLKPHRV